MEFALCKCLTSFEASFTVSGALNSNHMEASVRLRTSADKERGKKKREVGGRRRVRKRMGHIPIGCLGMGNEVSRWKKDNKQV